jgi:hypothetical protein
MSDISLLPEGLRGKEQQDTKKRPSPVPEAESLKMHIPESEPDENVEILEVDESELGAILSDEPFLTRLTYQISAAIDSLKERFAAKEEVPPPKTPPQFFTPPKPGLVSKPVPPALGAAAPVPAVQGTTRAVPPAPAGVHPLPGRSRPRARITPQAEVPKRVRVIRRVRKSVRVSLIPADQLAMLTVDVPKRIWTLSVISLLFIAIIVGGYAFMNSRNVSVRSTLADLNREVTDTKTEVRKMQASWSQYADLQQRLVLLNDTLKNHMMISRVFNFLEARTLPDVSYQSVTLSPTGALSLDVKSTSFQSAARQLVSFQSSTLVKDVNATAFTSELDGETGAVKSVRFQLVLTLDTTPLRGPLLAQENGPATTNVTLPLTTTASSTPGAPESASP